MSSSSKLNAMALPKRVHFSDAPLTYTYTPPATPRTPSPTWSDSSLHDDDSGPSTPPSASSFPPRALPPTPYESSKQLLTPSPILFDPRTQKSQIVWDVTTSPSNASIRSARKGKSKEVSNALLPSDNSLPATNPGTSSLDIHIPQLPPFWKPIQLRRNASLGSPGKSINVGEVLDAVSRYLQIAVSQKEFKMLPGEVQKAIAKSFWQRHDVAVKAGRTAEAEAIKKAGLRRIDALGGNTQFVAFAPMSNSGDAWQVILASTPP